MTADSPANAPQPTASKPKPTKPRPRWPSLWHWIFIGVCIGFMFYAQATDPVGDHAVANILTLISGFIVFCTMSVWFTFRSGYSLAARAAWPVLVVLVFAGFCFAYRIDGVDGDLVPNLRLRWAQPADALVGDFEPAAAESAATFRMDENAFPRFLGPNGNAVLTDRLLERDWKKNAPEELWRIKIGAGWSPFSVAGDLAVTLEQRGQEEAVTCYDLTTGELRWSHTADTRHVTVMGGVGPRSAATLHDGKVFAVGATGDVYCIEAETGELQWTMNLLDLYGVTAEEDLKRIAWGRSGSPLIVDDLLVVPAGGSVAEPVSLVALKQENGEVVWQKGDHLPSYASPALYELDGETQIVTLNADLVTGHDPKTGDVLWSHAWPGNSAADANCSQPHRVDSNHIFLSKGYSAGCLVVQVKKVDGDWTTSEPWKQNRRSLKTKFTNVAIYQGHAYGLSDGILECVNVIDGKQKWKRGRYGHGQVLIVGDTLLVQAESGEVVMLDASPDKHRELGKLAALDGQTWNNLCLAGDLLLVRNAQEAACYRLALRQPVTKSGSEPSESDSEAKVEDADETGPDAKN